MGLYVDSMNEEENSLNYEMCTESSDWSGGTIQKANQMDFSSYYE